MRFFFADNTNPSSLASKMRRARLEAFLDMLPAGSDRINVLDVGGTEEFWLSVWDQRCDRLSITLLNLTATALAGDKPICSIAGDARNLSRFGNGEFHLCFSNSVIEHVGTLSDQRRMANEIQRVAKAYFVQTPYRYFVLEPHFHFPGWAQMPVEVRTWLHQKADLGWLKAEPDYLQARIDVEQIRLISLREFRMLFPGAKILKERVGPLIKSIIAVGRCA